MLDQGHLHLQCSACGDGMVGVVQVGKAVNREAIEDSAEAMKAQFAMNTDRLENYLALNTLG